jgi:predicted RNase H-related nuclease YkuK (DUF458 family)
MRKSINIEEVAAFIDAQSPETKIYIGGDSERVTIDWIPYADFCLAIIVHFDGKHGCKIFGEVQRERVYDAKKSKPRMRLMTEVYKVAELYLKLHEVLEDRLVEVHLDLSPDEKNGSNCVVQEAIGYIRGMCHVTPVIKPAAFAASFAADRMKQILDEQEHMLA